jgi:hypothetical protein
LIVGFESIVFKIVLEALATQDVQEQETLMTVPSFAMIFADDSDSYETNGGDCFAIVCDLRVRKGTMTNGFALRQMTHLSSRHSRWSSNADVTASSFPSTTWSIM